jgi:hypothetical protein
MKITPTLFLISIFAFSFNLKADAQVFASETLQTMRICNTIMNMQDANPNNPQLRIGRRECNVRAYNVRLCTSSGGEFAECWDTQYTRPVQITTEQLEGIIDNDR